MNRHTLTIAGVVPADFRGTSPVMQYELWVPVTMGPTMGLMADAAFRERDQQLDASAAGARGYHRAGARRDVALLHQPGGCQPKEICESARRSCPVGNSTTASMSICGLR